jgi:hypothetical protein
MLFDIWLQPWTSHPIAAPLPLGGPHASVTGDDGGAAAAPADTDAEREGQHVNVSQNVTADQYIEEFTWTAPYYIIDMKGV